MSALRRLDAAWMGGGSAETLASLRVLIGAFAVVYLLLRLPNFRSFGGFREEQFEPVGVVGLLLRDPLAPHVWDMILLLTLVVGVMFVLGLRFCLAGPLFAALFLLATTYRNSWGQVFHVENLLLLHVIVLGIAPSAHALSLDARRGAGYAGRGGFGWPINLMCVLTVTVYCITGYTKLDTAGLDWAFSDTLRNQIAYDNLRKEALGDIHSPLGGWMVQHGWLFPPLAVLTLVIELGGAVTVFGRWWSRSWVLLAWGFHVGILVTMAIIFPYQLAGFAFLPFLRPNISRVCGQLQERLARPRASERVANRAA